MKQQAFVSTGAAAGGIPITFIVAGVFSVLKVTNTIAWSWWWVLSPLWISVGLYAVAMVAFALFALSIVKDD